MTVDSKHPLYSLFIPDWEQMRDTYRGQRTVKEAGAKYLPPTSGMIADGVTNAQAEGYKAYVAYRARARFPGLVRQAVDAMLGVMHHKPPTIELPAKLEPLRDRATATNESLEMLLRRINEEQLVTGRLGLLGEVPNGMGEQLPYIAFYRGEDPINWDEGTRSETGPQNLNLVVLNESEYERGTSGEGAFEWTFRRKYRVLVLGDVQANEPAGDGIYQVGVFREKAEDGRPMAEGEVAGVDFDSAALITPSIAGTPAREIPFVFVNAKDIVASPDDPPLLEVSNLALTIYRGEADYRQALFMQAQDTLVTIGDISETGSPKQWRIGAGASIDLPIGGDAKFIGVDSQGLPEMRMSIENDTAAAGRRAGDMLDDTSREKESGEALKVRVAAKTATLRNIALAGAAGLQEILRIIARWVGANPDEVIVTPNLDFTDDVMTGQELAQLLGAKTMGAPLSLQTIHTLMEERGITKLTLEEEIKAMEEEETIDVLAPPAESTDPDGPEDDPEEEESEEEREPPDDGE